MSSPHTLPAHPSDSTSRSPPTRQPASPPHTHHTPRGLDAENFPVNTEAGPQDTDEYITRNAVGFIRPEQEDPTTAVASYAPSQLTSTEKTAGLDIKLVTFFEGDLNDPRNWKKSVKWIRTMTVAFTCFVVAMGSSLIVMDMGDVAAEFNVSIDIIHLTVSTFVFGFAIGPLVFAPLSEIYGRKPIINLSMFLFLVFTFPSAFARNATTLVVGRALAGLAASAPMTIIGGTLADMWNDEERGLPMAIFSGTLFAGPVVGPVVAGFLSAKGWRWNYYLLLVLSGAAWLAATLFLPETYAVVLLRHRADHLRKETGDQGYMTNQERFRKPLSEVMATSLIRPLLLLVEEPIIFLFTLYLTLIYSLLYLFFFALPIIFGEIHHWRVSSVGLSFLPVLIGMLLCFASVIPMQAIHYAKATKTHQDNGTVGPVPPEARLFSMLVGGVCLPIGLFVFAWSSYEDVHWIVPMIGTGLFGYSWIAIYVGANSYIVDAFPHYAASAMASKTFMTRLCGGAVPMFSDRLYHSQMGPRWASCMLALIAVAMLPIPLVFRRYGPRIRAASKRSSE